MPAPASRDGLRLLVLSLDPPEHPDGHLSHSLALGGSGFEAAFDQGLLDPVAFAALLAECESGSYDHVHATFPSQTFDCSAARCLRPRDAPEGSGRRIAGGLTVAERAQLDAANALVQRGIRLFIAVTASGGTVSGESPSDLGDDSLACYAPEQSDRAFLAQMPEILAFQLLTGRYGPIRRFAFGRTSPLAGGASSSRPSCARTGARSSSRRAATEPTARALHTRRRCEPPLYARSPPPTVNFHAQRPGRPFASRSAGDRPFPR